MMNKIYKLPLNNKVLNKNIALNVYKDNKNKVLLLRGGSRLTENKITLLTNHEVRFIHIEMSRIDYEEFMSKDWKTKE